MSNDKTIKLSDIQNADFNEDTEPKDEYFIELFTKALKGEIDCRKAIILLSGIKPFSDYVPVVSKEYKQHFIDGYNANQPHFIYVYEREGEIIMSDDYSSYYLYKLVGANEALCIVLGE